MGNERDYDLALLCVNCHKWIEKQKKNATHPLSRYEQKDLLNQRKSGYIPITKKDIADKFCMDYEDRDYCRNGDLDLCKLDVIKEVFKEFCISNGYNHEARPPCEKIRTYFRNKRYEIILKFIDNGAPQYIVRQRTKFSDAMISKVYKDPAKAEKIINRMED